MKTLTTFTAVLLVSTGISLAQTNQMGIDLQAPVHYSREWKPHPELWQSVLSGTRELPHLSLSFARHDFVMQGPLAETFRPSRAIRADDSFEGKLRRIPILNLVIPYRMPMPPEGRSPYFAWGASARPWVDVASGAPADSGGGSDPVTHRSSAALISISR